MQELATSLQTDAGMVVPPGFTCTRTNARRLDRKTAARAAACSCRGSPDVYLAYQSGSISCSMLWEIRRGWQRSSVFFFLFAHFSRFSPRFNFLELLASAFASALFIERVVRQPTAEIAAPVSVRA